MIRSMEREYKFWYLLPRPDNSPGNSPDKSLSTPRLFIASPFLVKGQIIKLQAVLGDSSLDKSQPAKVI